MGDGQLTQTISRMLRSKAHHQHAALTGQEFPALGAGAPTLNAKIIADPDFLQHRCFAKTQG